MCEAPCIGSLSVDIDLACLRSNLQGLPSAAPAFILLLKLRLVQQPGVQMSNPSKLGAGWMESDVVYTVFSSILPQTPS